MLRVGFGPEARRLHSQTTGVNFDYTVSGAGIPDDLSPTVAVYWASGTTTDTEIGAPFYSADMEKAQGTYPSEDIPTGLGQAPPGANYLIAVADPAHVILTSDTLENVQALALPTILVNSVLPGKFWQSAAGGGGIDLQYTVLNPSDAPLNNIPVVCSWSSTPGLSGSTAYTLTLNISMHDSNGEPALADGDHSLGFSFAKLAALPGADPSPADPLADVPEQYLHIELDPGSPVDDLVQTSQSTGDEQVLPLSIEVGIHGWNPPWSTSDPSQLFVALVDQLKKLPAPGTILYNRVVGFAPNWANSQNDKSFTYGFAALVEGNIDMAEWEMNPVLNALDYPAAQIWFAIGEGIGTNLDSQVNAAAINIEQKLAGYGGYMQLDNPANPIIHVEVIGHSRGGGVAAEVLDDLRKNGLSNEASLITLDGYDSTWS